MKHFDCALVDLLSRQMEWIVRRMEKAGILSVTIQLLPDARHDLLHEEATTAADARKALIDWMARTLG
ncbi:MAG: hypothetical protein ACI3XG_07650 [Faecousia sp.]